MTEELDPITRKPFIEGAGRHVPPPGADWIEHTAGMDCLAHMEQARQGEVRYAGTIVPDGPPVIPPWRARLADRPPTADWWRRRHHCSDVVLGQRPDDPNAGADSVDF
jgi:hypothetical protein